MMWYYGPGGGGWFWMTMVGMLLFWGGVAALVVWLARRSSSAPHVDGAMDILRRRLAAGEITPEDFEKTKKTLGA